MGDHYLNTSFPIGIDTVDLVLPCGLRPNISRPQKQGFYLKQTGDCARLSWSVPAILNGKNVPLASLDQFLLGCDAAIARASPFLRVPVSLEHCLVNRLDLAIDLPVASAGPYIAYLGRVAPAKLGTCAKFSCRGTSATLALISDAYETRIYDKTNESGFRFADGLEAVRIELKIKPRGLRQLIGIQAARDPRRVQSWLLESGSAIYANRTAWIRPMPDDDPFVRIANLRVTQSPGKAITAFALWQLFETYGAHGIRIMFRADARTVRELKSRADLPRGKLWKGQSTNSVHSHWIV